MIKKIEVFLALVCVFLLSSSITLADGEFTTNYNITYEITESGETRVSQDIEIVNNIDNFYASSFTITSGLTRLSNVESYDSRGQQDIGVTQKNNETNIKITFNQQVIGKGNRYNWTLKYITKDIAEKSGNIWEINIPRPGNIDEIGQYNVTLVIPKSFSQPTYITPKPLRGLTFSKDQLLKSGITAIFGSYQIYNLELSYHLKNEKVTAVYTEIALPSDTAYQKVAITSIEPQPKSIISDHDGNWLARYDLKPEESINARVSAEVKTYFSPQEKVFLTQEQRDIYTRPFKYWEADNPTIKERANKLKTAKAIYDFVSNTLRYDFQKVGKGERLGSIKALQNPENAICMEFTDLFIGLARAANIPAREVDGYANTENNTLRPVSLDKDILHAWPEYYDDEQHSWIQVDPTWGNTTKGVDYFNKLDFNHIAFVTKGEDSTYPFPAGAYKLEGQSEKDVTVTVTSKELDIKKTDMTISYELPKFIISGLENRGKVVIKNTGAYGYTNLTPNLQGDPLDVILLSESNLSIPPYSEVKIPFKFKRASYFDNITETLILKIGEQKKETEIQIRPFFVLVLAPLILILLTLTVIIIKKHGRKIKNKTKKSS